MVQKICKLIQIEEYDTDIVKYIPGRLELVYQGMLEDIDTKDQPAHISYKDMENLEYQMLLNNSYYINPNSIHIRFPMKIKNATTKDTGIDFDLIRVNNFLHN